MRLASVGVNLRDEWMNKWLYRETNEQSSSPGWMDFVIAIMNHVILYVNVFSVELAEKYFHIFSFIVRFHLSKTRQSPSIGIYYFYALQALKWNKY